MCVRIVGMKCEPRVRNVLSLKLLRMSCIEIWCVSKAISVQTHLQMQPGM